MKAIVAVLATLFVVCVFSQTPSTPSWPQAFSATVMINSAEGSPFFTRWFFDIKNLRERFDFSVQFNGAMTYTQNIFIGTSTTKGNLYTVYYTGDSVACFYNQTSNYKFTNPNFSSFKYVGTTLVDYTQAYLWITPEGQSNYYEYYENTATGEPLEFDFVDSSGFQRNIRFFEFDAGAQDPSLFSISPFILSNCNQVKQ